MYWLASYTQLRGTISLQARPNVWFTHNLQMIIFLINHSSKNINGNRVWRQRQQKTEGGIDLSNSLLQQALALLRRGQVEGSQKAPLSDGTACPRVQPAPNALWGSSPHIQIVRTTSSVVSPFSSCSLNAHSITCPCLLLPKTHGYNTSPQKSIFFMP